jgi:hypothetical protein
MRCPEELIRSTKASTGTQMWVQCGRLDRLQVKRQPLQMSTLHGRKSLC